MHDTAMQIGSKFIATYASPARRLILEIGAQDLNGSLRHVCPPHCLYLGLDVEHGKGVDVTIDPSRPLPLRAEFSDLTISTSQMEHDPRFWSTFLELCRVTRKGGLIYLSVPSNGVYHSYPIDAWRFYPDAGKALAALARDNGYEITLLESFTAPRQSDMWNDFVAIFFMGLWNEGEAIDYLTDHFDGRNAWKLGFPTIQNYSAPTQDNLLLATTISERDQLRAEVEVLTARVAELTEPVLSLPPEQGLMIKPASATRAATSLPACALPGLQQGHLSYRYKGIETLKCPFDLALYALLVWTVRPRTIFEIGSNKGGSAVWLADLLRSYGIDGHVQSFDLKGVSDIADDRVTFHVGDASALENTITPDFMEGLPRPFLVIEDSSHQRAHSLAVMSFFDQYLREGEYMIVEDAIVSDLGLADALDGGPGAAIAEFLAAHDAWRIDRSYCDFFGPNVTWNVDGYLVKGAPCA